ncbi:MAG TPA: hypothetical protein PL045_12995 [Chitinophagaceae bacterium]|nr:hypothetical protein [Chitinophagaceae bacterium]
MKSKILLAAAIIITTASVVLAAAASRQKAQDVYMKERMHAPAQTIRSENFSSIGYIFLQIQ